jgi:GT2 family glycosyltransferase
MKSRTFVGQEMPQYMTMSKIYVVLPVHNRREITLRFVDCLKRQTYQHYHLLLIDDGSTDETSESVLEQIPESTILRGIGDWWWAGSLQQAYCWLKNNKIPSHEYVLVMNDDTEFKENFLETGLSIIKDKPGTILTATGFDLKTGQPRDSGGYTFIWKSFACLETYDNDRINCLSTRGMLANVADFLSVGGFFPKLVPHYLSDLEFTMRAKEHGLKLMITNEFRIYINFDKTGYRDISEEPYFHFLRKMFSKRATMNPISWTNFILLRCPWSYKLQALIKLWASVCNQIFVARFKSKVKTIIKRILPSSVQHRVKKTLLTGMRIVRKILPS